MERQHLFGAIGMKNANIFINENSVFHDDELLFFRVLIITPLLLDDLPAQLEICDA